jgi:hypothetical protein
MTMTRRLLAIAALIGLAFIAASAFAVPAGRAFFRSNRFYSPSGNIECKVLFDSRNRPVMACTTFNNGRVAYMWRYSRAYRAYDNGTYGFSRGLGPTLAYNTYWKGYGYECDSLFNGMQCTNGAGHGFTIAREGISRF